MELRFGPILAVLFALLQYSTPLQAQDAASKAIALRLSGSITGGTMPTSDPLFTQMANLVAAGNIQGAADVAAKSKYFASYLARRLALQMQTPALDATAAADNDATAFLIAHFAGAPGVPPSISSIWSDNSTYTLNINGSGGIRAASLTPAQKENLNWQVSLERVAGQSARASAAANAALVPIPLKHVGGYTTLSDRPNDLSYAMFGATAGTNLRFIEGIWQISTGLALIDVSSTNAIVQDVPRFIPQSDPNFFEGQGQAACLSCHGGGMPSANHGYAAVADIFDFAANGFVYMDPGARANNTLKSLGSDVTKRAATATCNLAANPKPVCNPDGFVADVNQRWNVGTTWGPNGVLTTMGWTGPNAGQGLNELGQALGQAGIVYKFMVKRVVNELCPLGDLSATEVARIAAAANPNANPKGTDDIRTIVAMVASHKSCL